MTTRSTSRRYWPLPQIVLSRLRTFYREPGAVFWVYGFSGIFFSPDRFPQVVQPVIRALPLTPLIEGLRGVMLEGTSLGSQSLNLVILLVWGTVTFVLGIKWFRWN